MRRLIAIALLLIPPISATAETYMACWVTETFDPVFRRSVQVTRCRLAGGEIVDFASDNEVPDRLYPAMGSVGGVACWYYTSRPNSLWVIVYVYPNGDADIALRSSDPTPVAIGLYSRCSAEPTEVDPIASVWEYVLAYVHPPPAPELDPEPGLGVTGLDTYLGVGVPDPHSAVLSAGGLTLQLEIEVAQVIIHWGDGTITTHPTDGPPLVLGPESPAVHMYEQKIPDARVTVAYSWDVRWRPVAGPWQSLAVPDTLSGVDYPVSEIVAVLGG